MRKTTTLTRIALTLSLCLVPAAAFAARVLAPADKTVVKQNSLVVLGSAPKGTEVPWSVRGKARTDKGVTKVDYGEVFEIFVLLEPGLNVVTVGEQPFEIFFDTGAGAVPKGFASQRLHAGDIGRCEDCHNVLTMALRDGGFPGACLGCHVVESQNPKNTADPRLDMHFQTAIATCGNCHEAHGSKDAKLLKGEATAQCGHCHPAQSREAQLHPAFQEGGCTACHDAHYSGFAKGLKTPQPGICSKCHEQGTGIDPARQHTGLTQGLSCSLCHEPHGSKSAKLLRKEPRTLCFTCHPKVLSGGHKEELSACPTCHDVHLAKGGGLLKGPVATECGTCHEKVAEGKTVHPAATRGCQTCHAPHSDSDLADAKTSCFKCHDLAKNRELASLHGGLTVPASACAKCHPAHSSQGDRLVRAKLHYPLTQGKCSVCHGGGDDRSLKVSDAAGRCRLCHTFEKQAERRGERLHQPLSSGECTACHDPHMSDIKGLLSTSRADTCRKCHTVEKDLKAKGEGVHDPVAEGDCTACHDPHSGNGKGLFRKPLADLCRACHDVAAATKGRTLHSAAEICTDCHRPHGGRNEKFLSAAMPGLCFNCHDDPRKTGSKTHAALDKGCLVCHDPHAGYAPGFLKATGNALCRTCHPDLKEHHPLDVPKVTEYPNTAKFPRDGKEFSCLGCHAAHSSDEPKLFGRPKKELCVSCHEEM